MGPLSNIRHERFAQELAKGVGVSRAYVLAGYEKNDGNASRLKGDEKVQARVMTLLEAGAARAEVTVERVVAEMAKLGFSDIRRVMRWSGNATQMDEAAAEDSGEVSIIGANQIILFDSDQIDEDTAAAISEIKQTKDGQLTVKMGNKLEALNSLARTLGMFKDKLEHSGTVDTAETDPDKARAVIAEWLAKQTGTFQAANAPTVTSTQ